MDIDLLNELIEQDPRLTTSCVFDALIYQSKHILHQLGKTGKYGLWIPDELSPVQLQQRVDVCME